MSRSGQRLAFMVMRAACVGGERRKDEWPPTRKKRADRSTRLVGSSVGTDLSDGWTEPIDTSRSVCDAPTFSRAVFTRARSRGAGRERCQRGSIDSRRCSTRLTDQRFINFFPLPSDPSGASEPCQPAEHFFTTMHAPRLASLSPAMHRPVK